MAFDFQKLEKAADAFLDIPFEDKGWSYALTSLCDAVDAAGAIVLPLFDRVPGPIPMTASMKEATEAYFRDGWLQNDIRMRGLQKFHRHGIITDFDNIRPSDMARDPYYQDLLRPHDIQWYAGLRLQAGHETWAISIQRGLKQDPFSQDEQQGLLNVASRISNSIDLLNRIETARLAGVLDSLEAVSQAALLLDRSGRVIHSNLAAANILGNGLKIKGGLLAVDGPDGMFLQRYLSSVIQSTDPTRQNEAAPIFIRRTCARPLIVRAQRIRGRRAWEYFSKAWVIVTIVDPDEYQAPLASTLRSMFELTAAESRVAIALLHARGSAPIAAAQLGISHDTIRTHLKVILSKTHTHSQSELVLLLNQISC